MSELRLRLDAYNVEELPQYGVVANIYDILEEPQERPTIDRSGFRNLVIPAGPGWKRPAFRCVQLKPGRYIVEALLPSEQVIIEEVTVEDSAEPQELRLRGDESPHEWLSWQQFVGNVPPDLAGYLQKESSIPSEEQVEIRADLLSVLTISKEDWDTSDISTLDRLIGRGFFFQLSSLVDSKPEHRLEELIALDTLSLPSHVTDSIGPNVWDNLYQSYHFGEEIRDQLGQSEVWTDEYRDTRFGRHFLFIRGKGIPPQYSVLPVPWRSPDPDDPGYANVEVLVGRSAVDPKAAPGTDAGFRTSVTVRDLAVGSVIGYLGMGQIPTAGTLIRQSRELLFSKYQNPLAAAVGAYVMITEEGTEEPKYWHGWVENLMNLFPWLPDGAIQHAWVMLNHRRRESDLHEARASLLEGYRRGLPFFSKGISMLRDGLTLFANDVRETGNPDEEVEEALRVVRQLALRTNMRQPITTVLLRGRI